MIRRRQKSCKEGVCSIQCFTAAHKKLSCMFQRLCTYFQHTGVLIFGGYVLSGHCNQQQISVKTEGYLFSEGYLFTGFYGSYPGVAPSELSKHEHSALHFPETIYRTLNKLVMCLVVESPAGKHGSASERGKGGGSSCETSQLSREGKLVRSPMYHANMMVDFQGVDYAHEDLRWRKCLEKTSCFDCSNLQPAPTVLSL